MRTYSGALNKYRNETIDYKPLRMNAGDTEVTVRTRGHPRAGAPVQIDYSMAKKADGWKAYDVIVGGVSLVTNYRDEFNEQIKRRRRRRPHQDARRAQQGRRREVSTEPTARRRDGGAGLSRRDRRRRAGRYAGALTFANAGPVLAATASLPLPSAGQIDLEHLAGIDSSARRRAARARAARASRGQAVAFRSHPRRTARARRVYGVESILGA